MASFEYHVNVAVIATGVLITPVYSSGLIDVNQSLIILGLGLVGGILPDLDSDNSKPIQIIFKMLSIFLPLLVLISINKEFPVLHLIGIWIVSTLVLQLLFFQLFLKLTSHRGIFHSIPMGIFLAQIVILLFYRVLDQNLTFSTIAGSFLFIGFIVHLLLDELVSVNALGFKMKKSFGSALKLYDKNNISGTVVLYALIAVLFFLTPQKEEVYLNLFEIFKNIKFI